MIKVIHCADLHLDSPMETHMNETQASKRNTELIQSFVRLTEYAVEQDVRAVMIAGDMFDGERVKKRTVDEVLDAIRRTASVDYLYLAGNHDEVANAFADHDIPDNLKMFGPEWRTYDITMLRFPELRYAGEIRSLCIRRFHTKMEWPILLRCTGWLEPVREKEKLI